jgi:hypothetical protein
MNKARRDALTKIAATIAEARSELASLRDEEQDYFDNMPESIQQGDKGQRAEVAVFSMEEAISQLEDAESNIDSACSAIE